MGRTKAEKGTRQQQAQVGTIQFSEGCSINWPVDKSLYARCRILKLNCDNIPEVELASLPEERKFKTNL